MLKRFIDFIRRWLELPDRINTLSEELDSLRLLVIKAVPTRRLAFVWGNCITNRFSRIETLQLVSPPEWIEEGEEYTFTIGCFFALNEIKLEVCEPFLITGVWIGNQLQAVSMGAARKWECSDTATPGNNIRIDVKWFRSE